MSDQWALSNQPRMKRTTSIRVKLKYCIDSLTHQVRFHYLSANHLRKFPRQQLYLLCRLLLKLLSRSNRLRLTYDSSDYRPYVFLSCDIGDELPALCELLYALLESLKGRQMVFPSFTQFACRCPTLCKGHIKGCQSGFCRCHSNLEKEVYECSTCFKQKIMYHLLSFI